MKQKKDFFQKMQLFCNKNLLLIIGLLILGIGIFSIFVTAFFKGIYNDPIEKTLYRLDNPIYLLAMTSSSIIAIYLIHKFLKKLNFKILFIAIILLVVIMQVIWVNKIRFIPVADQLSVILLGNDLATDNYDAFKSNTSYFGTYPFQLGIIYYIALLFKIFRTNSYFMLQCANILFSTMNLILMYKIICNLFENKDIKRIGLIIVALFSTYFMFFNVHIYGNIPGLTFGLISLLYTIKYLKNKKKLYLGIISMTIGISILLKSNYNIFLCGIIICLFMDLLKEYNWKKILSIVLILFMCMIISFGAKTYLEKKIESKIPDGMPTINYIYMGMDKPTKRSSGWYNSSNINLLKENNYDLEKTKEEAKIKIKERINEFKKNPKEFICYYSDKLASTWLNPTFQVIWCNYPGAQMKINEEYRTYIENSTTLKSILSGDMYKLEEKFFDVLQIIVFMFAAYAILKLYKLGEIQMLLLPLIFLGGFVFHILWETKSVYVLQYYFLLIPYTCYGLNEFYKKADKILMKNITKILK